MHPKYFQFITLTKNSKDCIYYLISEVLNYQIHFFLLTFVFSFFHKRNNRYVS